MQVLFKKINDKNELPTYGSREAAGMDIYSPISFALIKGERKMIPLGFSTMIPQGYVGLVVPRSSSGTKKGIRLTNSVGVIDSDYRGEWHAPLTSDIGCDVDKGERILQVLFLAVDQVEAVEVSELPDTERGSGGFGSTGA